MPSSVLVTLHLVPLTLQQQPAAEKESGIGDLQVPSRALSRCSATKRGTREVENSTSKISNVRIPV